MFHDKRLLRMGDTVLRVWARILQESCRKEDLAARIGGTVFLVQVLFILWSLYHKQTYFICR